VILEFIDRHALTLHGMVVVFGLIVYVGASRALPQRRDPSAAIAWVVALALLPYVAIPLFLMFGSRKLRMRDEPQPATPPLGPPADAAEAASMWARRLGRSMGLAPAAPYEGLHIHADGGEARRALLDVIASATKSLDVCTFILARDRLGEEIAAALRAKAEQGVRVRLLIDGIGAWLAGRVDVRRMRASGVETVKFVPPFRSILRGRANLRNHRKIVVADTDRLWCGGRNFAAEYFEGGPTRSRRAPAEAVWHDLSFDLRGALAVRACEQFEKDWAYATRTTLPEACPPAPHEIEAVDAPLAQLVPSGPDQIDDTVQSLLLSACFMARRRIVAITP
jgi:cardiolipin synthase